MKTVVITGSASGLGRGLATQFVADGDRVVGMDRDHAALQAVAAELGDRFTPVTCDLLDTSALRTTAETIAAEGPVDILIHNAGIVTGKPFTEIEDGEVERVFGVNVFAPFLLTRIFLPGMIRAGRGHVVTIASAGGLVATARMAPYASSKFAAVGFDEALRYDLQRAGHPVKTTVVCPFYINTGMFDGARTRLPWLLPIVSTEYAVSRIYRAIRKGRRRLIMPRFVNTVFLARLLPVRAFDALVRWLGITSSMDEFRGR